MAIRRSYAASALIVLGIEIGIAALVAGGPVRTHFGDVLAIILVWLALRAIGVGPFVAIALALATGIAIEAAQWLELTRHFAPIPILRIVLGSRSDPWDLLAYLAGACAALAIETVRIRCVAWQDATSTTSSS
jgi:hypothetical protein